jgi:hypothetical protein
VDDNAVWTAVGGGYQHGLSQTVVCTLDDYAHAPRQDELAESGEQGRRVRLPQLTAGADGFTAMSSFDYFNSGRCSVVFSIPV